jgi:hypothetical protein
VIAALNGTFPRAGCRPYPDFMSFSSNVAETQSLFGIYAIMVSERATDTRSVV